MEISFTLIIWVGMWGLPLVLGLKYIGKHFQDQKRRRLVKNTPTSTIQSASIGPVELIGTVAPNGKSLHAPVDETPCEFYHLTSSRA